MFTRIVVFARLGECRRVARRAILAAWLLAEPVVPLFAQQEPENDAPRTLLMAAATVVAVALFIVRRRRRRGR